MGLNLPPLSVGESDYRIQVANAHGVLSALRSFDRGATHTEHVAGVLVSAPKRSSPNDDLKVTATVLLAVDPDLGSTLLYAALLGVRHESRETFDRLMKRLADAGHLVP